MTRRWFKLATATVCIATTVAMTPNGAAGAVDTQRQKCDVSWRIPQVTDLPKDHPVRLWHNDPRRLDASRRLDKAVGPDTRKRLESGVLGVTFDDTTQETVVVVDPDRLAPSVEAEITGIRKSHPEVDIEMREGCTDTSTLLAAQTALSDRAKMVGLVGDTYTWGLDPATSRFWVSMPCASGAAQRLTDRLGGDGLEDSVQVDCATKPPAEPSAPVESSGGPRRDAAALGICIPDEKQETDRYADSCPHYGGAAIMGIEHPVPCTSWVTVYSLLVEEYGSATAGHCYAARADNENLVTYGHRDAGNFYLYGYTYGSLITLYPEYDVVGIIGDWESEGDYQTYEPYVYLTRASSTDKSTIAAVSRTADLTHALEFCTSGAITEYTCRSIAIHGGVEHCDEYGCTQHLWRTEPDVSERGDSGAPALNPNANNIGTVTVHGMVIADGADQLPFTLVHTVTDVAGSLRATVVCVEECE